MRRRRWGWIGSLGGGVRWRKELGNGRRGELTERVGFETTGWDASETERGG